MQPAAEMREMRASDADAAGRIFVEAYPHRAREVRLWRERSPRERPQRWIAVAPSTRRVLGYAALWHVEQGKHRIDVVVERASRKRGIGARLHDLVSKETIRIRARTMQARAYAESTESISFLEHREYRETMRMHGFELDLGAVNEASLVAAASCAGSAVEIAAPGANDLEDAEFWRGLGKLHAAAREGWPNPDPGGRVQRLSESGLRTMLLPGDKAPVAFFVAVCRGEFVGYSALAGLSATCDQAQFAATAVRPDFRKLRIATTLRARCLIAAKAAGIRLVRSATGHPAMVRINQAFGFQASYCEIRFVRPVL